MADQLSSTIGSPSQSGNTHHMRYPYRALPSRRHFRVIELLPRSYTDKREKHATLLIGTHLYGSVSTHSIDEVPDYQCLSYTWGDLQQLLNSPYGIQLDEHIIPITENLAAALRAMQQDAATQTVWVDFICINQADVEERKHQVQLMYEIYSKATSVFVYLGRQADASERIPELLQRIEDAHVANGIDNWDKWNNAKLVALDLPPNDDAVWVSLMKFYRRPWFTRVWVIQEAIAAKKLEIACGVWKWPAVRIVAAVDLMIRHGLPMFDSLRQNGNSTNAGRALRQLDFMMELGLCKTSDPILGDKAPPVQIGGHVSRHWTLLDVLEATKYADATDARDRVFALLNLCQDAATLGVEPDYTNDTCETYKHIARCLVAAGHAGRLLLNAGTSVSSLVLPSWVPDWSAAVVNWRDIVASNTLFNPDDPRSRTEPCTDINIGDKADHLNVSVVGIGRVSIIQPTLTRTRDLERARTSSSNASDEPGIPFDAPTNPHSDFDSLNSELPTSEDAFRLAENVMFYIHKSPHYEKSNALSIAWQTLLCNHAGSLDGGLPDSTEEQFAHFFQFALCEQSQELKKDHIDHIIQRVVQSNPDLADAESSDTVQQLLLSKVREYYDRELELANEFHGKLTSFCFTHHLVATETGYVGMAPRNTQEGDFTFLIKGVKAPMIARLIEGKSFQLVGPAYFYGFMKRGSGFAAELEKREPVEIVLV